MAKTKRKYVLRTKEMLQADLIDQLARLESAHEKRANKIQYIKAQLEALAPQEPIAAPQQPDSNMP